MLTANFFLAGLAQEYKKKISAGTGFAPSVQAPRDGKDNANVEVQVKSASTYSWVPIKSECIRKLVCPNVFLFVKLVAAVENRES